MCKTLRIFEGIADIMRKDYCTYSVSMHNACAVFYYYVFFASIYHISTHYLLNHTIFSKEIFKN
jgi:hypothetical protein